MTESRWRFALASIAATAVLVRLAHVASLLRSPIGDALVQDARLYHEQALRILGVLRPLVGDTTPFNNLGYPYVLAGLYALAGPRPAVALFAQAVLGGVSAALMGVAARDLLRSRLSGLVAAALYALAQTSIFYDGLLLTPSTTNLALLAALAALGRRIATGRQAWTVAAGLAVGCATLLRTNLVLALPAFAGAALVAAPGEGGAVRRRARTAALLSGAALALPLAVAASSAARTGAWVPLTANGGMNFWLGNNPAAQGVYYVAPFLGAGGAAAEAEAYLVEARRRSGDPTLTLAGAARYWLREGLVSIRETPRRWLLLELRKAALFGNGFETKTNAALEVTAAFSRVLRWAPVRMELLTVAGGAGLALLAFASDRRAFVLFGGIVLAALATCTLFFVSGEYRHAALPALCASAAWAVVAVARRSATIPRRAWWVAAAAASAAAALTVPSWPGIRRAMPPDLGAGDLVRAIVRPGPDGTPPERSTFARARELLDRSPSTADGRIFRLDTARWLAWAEARAFHDRGAAVRALAAARELLAINLGEMRTGYEETFLADLRRSAMADVQAIAVQPWAAQDPELAREAALLGSRDFAEAAELLDAGRPAEARAFLEQALRRTPNRVEPTALLGKALYALGDRTGAIRAWGAACAGWPQRPDCAFYVAEMYAREGNAAQARVAADEALRRDPSYAPAIRLRSGLR